MIEYLGLILLGLFAGGLGSLLGVGGAFIMVPILMVTHPELSHVQIAAATLSIVFIASLTSMISYFRIKRVNLMVGVFLGLISVPGGIIGTSLRAKLPFEYFKIALGCFLVVVAIILFINSYIKKRSDEKKMNESTFSIKCKSEVNGEEVSYNFNPFIASPISVSISILASMIGIGGGVFNVPIFVHILGIPMHIATATSQMVVTFVSFSGSMTDLIAGKLTDVVMLVVLISIGIIPGAYFGAKISGRVSSKWLVRSFAVILVINGIRMLTM